MNRHSLAGLEASQTMILLTKMLARVSGWRLITWLSVFIVLSVFLAIFSMWDFGSSLSTQLFHLHETLYGSIMGSDSENDNSKNCVDPLRVYMYDLPAKFNLGMLRPGVDQASPWTRHPLPRWPVRSGLKRQHSVEYWMMLSLLDSSTKDQVAIRVFDPNRADVFFVPFFSSLSFNTHGLNMLDPETEKDRVLQVEIVDFLHNSSWWQRSRGQDHVLPLHHPNAFRFEREKLNNSIFIVSDFGRYTESLARLRKDVVAPYMHVVDSYGNDNVADSFEARTTLLFFRGTVSRKDDGVVRTKLAKLLRNHSHVLFQDSTAKGRGIELATSGMRASRFCLTPAGDTPSSCRLFDAIASHCVPVIISDKLELPFEDDLDYEEFCVIFSVQEALVPGHLLRTLEDFPKETWLRMWRKLKSVAHHFEYQHPALRHDAVDMTWTQVKRKLPAVRLAKHRLKRLKIADWWHW